MEILQDKLENLIKTVKNDQNPGNFGKEKAKSTITTNGIERQVTFSKAFLLF